VDNAAQEYYAIIGPPTATAHNQTVTPGTSIPLSTLFTYSSPVLSDSIVGFDVEETSNSGGYLTNNGVSQPAGDLLDGGNYTYGIPIGQIGQWAFVAGPAGVSNSIAFNVDDETGQSNPTVTATVSSIGSQPPPAGTTADMILKGGDPTYEIYDIGTNAILAAYQLGQVGAEWQVAGLGGFYATDTTDMLLRNSNTGAFEVYDITNNQITAASGMGQVGLEWQVAGFGDFLGNANETDMLMHNTSTGQFEVYDITNNQITAASGMGQVGLEWSVAGFGDFLGNANETDMLMRNSNTGAFEVYDITSNQITAASGMGQVGLEWSVAGFGDFLGNANETDMLLRNSNTGAFEVYDITSNQITAASGMGQVGLEWQVAGVAANLPTGSAPSLNTQLMQAMASFSTNSSSSSGEPTADVESQQVQLNPLVTQTQHV
jgi:hypothetical protein